MMPKLTVSKDAEKDVIKLFEEELQKRLQEQVEKYEHKIYLLNQSIEYMYCPNCKNLIKGKNIIPEIIDKCQQSVTNTNKNRIAFNKLRKELARQHSKLPNTYTKTYTYTKR